MPTRHQRVEVHFARCAALGVVFACACANFDRRVDAGNADAPAADLPPPPATALADVTRLGAGRSHTCAVDAMGAVWCWGRGDDARVGTTVSRTCPSGACVPFATRVAGVADVAKVGGGSASSCARDRGGSVSCWGDNSLGQGGAAGMTTLTTPTAVPDLPALADLAVGGAHACGVAAADGAVRCWGYGEIGQFGDGARPAGPRPVTRVVALDRAGRVFAGDAHGCALDGRGAVRCWGATAAAQAGALPGEACPATRLGGWPTRCVTSPSPVALPAPAAELALGYYHTCARLTDGAVWCWGSNEHGQLGGATAGTRCGVPSDSTDTRSVPCSASPVRVAGLSGAFVERIWSGMRASHTCARLRGGGLRCWGDGRDGQLGDGARVSSLTPRAPRALADATELAAGEAHTCAVAAGRVVCWGDDGWGQLGDGDGAAGGGYVLRAP